MKVLFISGGDSKYGAPKSMMTLIEGLQDNFGVKPILLTKKHNELNDYCSEHGIENYSFWYRDIMAGSPYNNKLLTIMKHSVKYAAYIYGSLFQKNIDKLPIDFSSIDIIHTNTNRQDIGVYLSRKYHIKHVWHIREMGKEDYNVIFYKKNCIQYMNQNTDAYVVISNAVRNKWKVIGIDNSKIHTIPDGMETDKISKSTRKNNSYIKIVITGHVQPNKGQLQLVNAIATLPDKVKQKIKLDIIGEAYPDYKKIIKKAIYKNGLQSQVRILGYKNDIGNLLANYDIGVNCSKSEGLGRSTIEYMLAGLFTIASDTGANPELIENEYTGLLYKYNDIKSLSEKIIYVVENYNESLEIAENGYQVAKTRFAKEHCIEKIYEVYKNVL